MSFLCRICGAEGSVGLGRFSSEDDLDDHIREVHLGWRPYACCYCEMISASIGCLSEHHRNCHATLEFKYTVSGNENMEWKLQSVKSAVEDPQQPDNLISVPRCSKSKSPFEIALSTGPQSNKKLRLSSISPGGSSPAPNRETGSPSAKAEIIRKLDALLTASNDMQKKQYEMTREIQKLQRLTRTFLDAEVGDTNRREAILSLTSMCNSFPKSTGCSSAITDDSYEEVNPNPSPGIQLNSLPDGSDTPFLLHNAVISRASLPADLSVSSSKVPIVRRFNRARKAISEGRKRFHQSEPMVSINQLADLQSLLQETSPIASISQQSPSFLDNSMEDPECDGVDYGTLFSSVFADLDQVAAIALNRNQFATKLFVKLIQTESEVEGANATGGKGRRGFNPTKIAFVRQCVESRYPPVGLETPDDNWKKCVIAMNKKMNTIRKNISEGKRYAYDMNRKMFARVITDVDHGVFPDQGTTPRTSDIKTDNISIV